MRRRRIRMRATKALTLVLLLLLSITLLRGWLGSPSSYGHYIDSLDEKKNTVTNLVVASTAVAATISVFPEDVGTPIADQLTDLTNYFLLVLEALYLEKYLLPIIGLAVTTLLFPASCIFGLLHVFIPRNISLSRIALKCAVFGLILLLVIPTSVHLSDLIESMYRESIQSTVDSALEANEVLKEEEAQDKNIWEKAVEAVQNIWGSVSGAVDWAKEVLNSFVEALAVLVVTHCVVPILVFLAFSALLKAIFRLDLSNLASQIKARQKRALSDLNDKERRRAKRLSGTERD